MNINNILSRRMNIVLLLIIVQSLIILSIFGIIYCTDKSKRTSYGIVTIYSSTGQEFSYYGEIYIKDNNIELYTV